VIRSVRQVAELALSRTSGAPLIPGNRVEILKNAAENYPRWLEAIRSAKRVVFFENYIFEEDEVGNQFAEALADRARAGVKVRLMRDWFGTKTGASRAFWHRMSDAGVEIRVYNPPRLDSPFGWLSRDHRKMIAVDGRVAYVAGLCVSQRWQGDPSKGKEPWRDTGTEIVGPAVAEVEEAFAQLWQTMGDPVPAEDLVRAEDIPAAGDVSLRIIAGQPSTAGLFRTDQIIAAVARKSLWLTDAYFVGVTPYVQALRAAAKDGVDVRLLVPNASDLPFIRPLSRSGYRSLLEAGVRIFEWNGPMVHAKTAVADGRWSRVGSSNLNLASFLGNYELDVAVDDEGVAAKMEEMYRQDLEHSTEIVLERNRVVLAGLRPPRPRQPAMGLSRGRRKGSAAAAGAIRIANAVGAAVTNHRVLGPAESRLLGAAGLGTVLLAVVGALFPRVLAWPMALLAAWLGLALLWRSISLRRIRRQRLALPAVETARPPPIPADARVTDRPA
jgi:cardiolipin synthase